MMSTARRYFILLWLLFITCRGQGAVAPPGAGGNGRVPDTAIVATVNGEPVMAGEFMLLAGKLRSQVVADFRNRYGNGYSGQFWLTEIGGTTPAGALRQLTLDSLIRIKVIQSRARDAGLVKDITYSGFLRSLERENRRREADRQNGKMLYGPVQYTVDVYYSYLLSNLMIRLQEVWASSVFNCDDTTLKAVYDQYREDFCSRGQVREAFLLQVSPFVLTGIDRKDAMAIAGTRLILKKFVFNDTIPKPEDTGPLEWMVRQAADTLQAGGSSYPVLFGNRVCTVFLDRKDTLGCRSFENCRNILLTNLLRRKFQQYTGQLAAEASCLIHYNVFDQLTIN